MATLTKQAIEKILGPTDDDLAAALVATGATEAELQEAYAWLSNDEAMMNQLRPVPSGRAADAAEVLRRFEEAMLDDD